MTLIIIWRTEKYAVSLLLWTHEIIVSLTRLTIHYRTYTFKISVDKTKHNSNHLLLSNYLQLRPRAKQSKTKIMRSKSFVKRKRSESLITQQIRHLTTKSLLNRHLLWLIKHTRAKVQKKPSAIPTKHLMTLFRSLSSNLTKRSSQDSQTSWNYI